MVEANAERVSVPAYPEWEYKDGGTYGGKGLTT